MKKFYKIDACHPIFKRVIESNLDEDAMVKLYKELQKAGYEDKDILLETTRIIHEAGDTIEITPEMYEALPDDVDKELEIVTPADRELESCKRTLHYIYGNPPQYRNESGVVTKNYLMTGTLEAKRLDREGRGQMIVKWNGAMDETWEKTNTYFLEALGFEFEDVVFDEIPLLDAPDELLGDYESFLKALMQQTGWDEEKCEEYLKPVHAAMNKAGCVFYRP